MMDACRRDGHNYVTNKTDDKFVKEVYCTKCGEVKVLEYNTSCKGLLEDDLIFQGRRSTPESGTEPVDGCEQAQS